MPIDRRSLGLGASAWALAAASPVNAQRRRSASPIQSYPAPTYIPDPPGTVWFAPSIPAYPQPIPAQRLIDDARRLSDALAGFITAWMDGRGPAVLPASVMPPGWNARDWPEWRLVRPDDVRPEQQWASRPAHTIDREALLGGFPDPNCTYLVGALYAPFGSKLVIEGEFPHARFFDIQVTPSFDPKSYRYDGWGGVGEVPIVDADIEPLPGHANPFRVGARRDASLRGYRVEFDMAIGDPVALNAAFRPPHFRDRGNRRAGGAILHQGPYADPRGEGHKRGRWDHGWIWIRYYRPDASRGPWGGVAPPRASLVLPDGRAFWIQADARSFARRVNRAVRPRPTSLAPTRLSGPEHGWSKQAGILRAIYSGFAIEANWAGKEYVRLFDRGAVARGSDLSAPNNYEQSATSCTYIDYLVRGMQCEQGHVVVLSGRLPLTPRTRAGDILMQHGEARYWSLTGYVVPEGWDMLGAITNPNYPAGLAAHCVMDEDVVLQAGRRYVIALSRPEDRPVNASPQAGVTWADWGLAGNISWTLRWMTVGPQWTSSSAPTPQTLGRRAEWAEESFDPGVLPNTHGGAIGEHLPVVSYMTKADFEALGPQVRLGGLPLWPNLIRPSPNTRNR
jgi:hypothetical protein